MFTAHEIDDLVERIRDWFAETDGELEALDAAAFPAEGRAALGAGAAAEGPAVGLLQLAEVMTALRHELKLETKSARQVQESVSTAIEGLDRAVRKFDSIAADESRAAEQAARPLVEALVDVDDAVGRAAKSFDAVRIRFGGPPGNPTRERLQAEFSKLPWWRRALARSWQHKVGQLTATDSADDQRAWWSLLEGIRILQARLDKTLAGHQIERIPCAERPVDPQTMTVVDLVDDPNRDPETVAEEIRPGYLWRGRVVRCAEVRAVRRPPAS